MPLNNISRATVKSGKTVRLKLDMLPPDSKGNVPTLVVEGLTHANTGWVSDSLRNTGADEIHLGAARNRTVEQVERSRGERREMLAKHSVRGFEFFYFDDANGLPDEGNPVTVSPATITEVVGALPPDVLDMVMTFVLTSDNFRDAAIVGAPSAVAKK